MRYYYATYATRQKAEDALEDCYASGEVSEAERPRIESYPVKAVAHPVVNRAAGTRYAITLEG